MVPIVVRLSLQSKGEFIGEIVKGSFRLSFLKELNEKVRIAYRAKYREYEKTLLLRAGILARIHDRVTTRVMVSDI